MFRRVISSAALLLSSSNALLLASRRPFHGAVRHMRMSVSTGAQAALPSLVDLTDPREWLEDVEGDAQIDWVKERNSEAIERIGEPSDKPLYGRLLEIMESDEKIPFIGRVLNGLYYNFWQDETHVQGIWRRCTPEEYRKPEPAWELVLDLDALSKAEGITWVWSGSTCAGARPRTSRYRVQGAVATPGGSVGRHPLGLLLSTPFSRSGGRLLWVQATGRGPRGTQGLRGGLNPCYSLTHSLIY